MDTSTHAVDVRFAEPGSAEEADALDRLDQARADEMEALNDTPERAYRRRLALARKRPRSDFVGRRF